jgi:methylmalonyl-CoA mutase
LIQDKVGKVRAAHEAATAQRKDALTGATDFPNLAEAPVQVLDLKPVPLGTPVANITYPALKPIRFAEPFERLRDASDQMLAKTGARPKIFLAALGTIAEFTARSSFAKRFFEAGGIEAETGDGFADRNAMIVAFQASGAKLACLCSTDDIYAAQATDAAKALTAAGAFVYLAGRPGEHEGRWRESGVKEFIYGGGNVLTTLQKAYDNLSA